MSKLKDHFLSVGAGVAAATAVVGAGAAGVPVFAGVIGAGAVGLAFATAFADAADAAAKKEVDGFKFKLLSAAGGFALSLAAAFGVANHLSQIPEAPEQTGQKSVPAQVVSKNQYSDSAQAFNKS